jgi:hypothetical protein
MQYGYFNYQPSTGQLMDREDSGEDWWFAHCNLYDATGTHIGYAAAGYNTMPNWKYVDGYFCFEFDGLDTDPHKTKEWEKPGLRKGALQSWLARYDLDGNQLWCRSYLPGIFYGVAQDTDGSIVAIGEAHANRKSTDLNNGQVVGYDPGLSDPVNLAELDCSMLYQGELLMGMQRKCYVTKIGLDGQVIWQNLYGWPTDHLAGWKTYSAGFGLAPITVDGGSGFYAVCHGGSGQAQDWNRMWAMRIRSDGTLVDRYMFDPTDELGTALGWTATNLVRGFSVKSIEHEGLHYVAIAGQYVVSQGSNAGILHAFSCLIEDMDADPYTVDAVYHTNSAALATYHAPSSIQNSSDIAFLQDGGQLALIWPVLSNYVVPTNWFAGRSVADLKVHRFDVGGGSTPLWTADLGEVRAYDLQAGVTSTADGNIAVVSSKWHPPFDLGNPFRYPDLPAHIQDHITTDFSGHDWVNTEDYDYWATSAYVAKLDGATGTPIWEMIEDAEPDKDHQIWPGDIRKQECLYKITEADDGGLVISGNTSHNFDDALLMKLRPDCQAKLAYDLVPDEFGQHMLPIGNTAWTADLSLHGEVIVPNGSTLSINGATIRFADSDQMHWASRIIVEPGGLLHINNATLTADDRCPNSMWDGVQLHGNSFARQLPQYQGSMRMENAMITHARTGVLAARGDPRNPLGPIIKHSTGGIVHASEATFLNNRYDAVFHPFENRLANGAITSNASYFNRCSLMTSGGLPIPGQFPADHVAMVGVRGIPFRGCAWTNTLLGPPMEWPFEQGTGIRAINSSFSVGNHCSALVTYPNPCPPANTTTSSFTNLHRGIIATTFDPSRTFSVDNASFTGTNFGIRMEGIQDASITRSTFNVPEPLIPGILGAVYGVYSDQCTGYQVQENHFLTAEPEGLNKKVGLIIKDSGKAPNLVYNNRFDDLYTGHIVQGKNRHAQSGEGLEIKCNDFGLDNINQYDVALTGIGASIAQQQGRSAVQFPGDDPILTNPAGNIFSDNCGINPQGDYFVQDEQGAGYIQYWFHQSATLHTEPICYNWIDPADALAQYTTKEEVCPSHLDRDGEVKRLLAHEGKEGYEETGAVYDATKDNGDSEGLLAYVESPANSSTAKRNALLSVAPKVSTAVWKATLESDPPLSDWHLTQALVGNSPLQGEVLRMAWESELPPFFLDLVQGAQTGEVNLLSVLEAELAWYGQLKAEALYGLAREVWLDSTGTWPLDSLLQWTDRYAAAHALLANAGVLGAKGQYSALESLAAAAESGELDGSLYSVLKYWAQAEQANGWAEPDAGTQAYLMDLGQQRETIGSAQANAWLHALGYDLPEEVIILPEDGPKRAQGPRKPTRAAQPLENLLEAYPNPTAAEQWLVYQLPQEVEQASVSVRDMLGREMEQVRLGQGTGIVELAMRAWPSGLYMATLTADGIPMGSIKLIVQR